MRERILEYVGTFKVDFAGTRQEAEEFVKPHRPVLHVGSYPNIGNEGLPMITTRYQSLKQKIERLALLESLGWDRGSVLEVPNTALVA
jgi:hypothetical protein